jgi:hypothetical protein
MDSYRLIINNYDLSTSDIEQTTDYTGFTVIKAPKGPCTPVRISASNTSKIQDIFGVASSDYPDLYEVTSFNAGYDVYVSAPYSSATVPAAVVTAEGVFPLATPIAYNDAVENLINGSADDSDSESGLSVGDENSILKDTRYPEENLGIGNDAEVDSYPSYKNNCLVVTTGLTMEQLITKSDGSTYSFINGTFTIKNIPSGGISEASADLKVSGNLLSLIVNNKEVGYLIKKTEKENPSKSSRLDITDVEDHSSTVCLVFEGTSEADRLDLTSSIIQALAEESIRENIKTYWASPITDDNVKGIIIPKYPSARPLHISFSSFNRNRNYSSLDPSSRNILKMTVYEEGAFHNESHPVTITGSLNSSAQDANGAYIGFTTNNSSYSDQDLIYVYSMDNKGFTANDKGTFRSITKYPAITLEGGTRISGDGASLYEKGWEKAQDEEYSSVDIFFDSQRHTSQPSESGSFFTLYNYHPLAGYIFNYTPSNINSISEPLAYGANYWNICNEAIINLSNSDKIISPMTGVRSLMQCKIIENRWGGVAPMYLNSGTPAVGGQLSLSGLYRLRYKYRKDEQEHLDEMNFNPVIQDHSYGVMVVGQKTCKAGEITDWSYIGHVSAFLNFQREVREQVMIPQLGKPNNPYYRTLRKEQVTQLLSKRLEGNNRIWAEASVDTSEAAGCNDIQAQRARKFLINVRVKVDIFSEYVELNFTNVDQSMSATE